MTRNKKPDPKKLAQLREAIELLREHVNGYEAKDGYSLREKDLAGVENRKRGRLIRKAAKLKELLQTPHDIIKPTTRKGRRSLIQFTRQSIRGAKHFIVHKPADNFRVHLRDGNVEIEGKFKGRVITRSEFYLFPRKPRFPKELVAMAKRLQKEMRPGFYTLITAAHGDTGEPFDRESALARLNEYLAAYEVDQEGKPTGFSEALIGFRLMSTTLAGASSQRSQIDARRQRQKQLNLKKRKAQERKTAPRKARKGK